MLYCGQWQTVTSVSEHTVSRDVTLCSMANSHQCFRTYSLQRCYTVFNGNSHQCFRPYSLQRYYTVFSGKHSPVFQNIQSPQMLYCVQWQTVTSVSEHTVSRDVILCSMANSHQCFRAYGLQRCYTVFNGKQSPVFQNIQSPGLLGLLNLEDGSQKVIQNISNYLPLGMAYHPLSLC